MKTRASILISAALIAVLVAGAVVALAAKPNTAGLEAHPVAVTATPIDAFDPGQPGQHDFGKLRFLGGLVLSSTDPDFGGYSGLALDADGAHLLSISDAGTWLTARLDGTDGRITGLADARMGGLLGKAGASLTKGSQRDAESVTLASGTLEKGEVLIGFEQKHRVQRFGIDADGVGAPTESLKLPDYAAKLQGNRGFESVAVLKAGAEKGSVLIFTEGRLDKRGLIRGSLLNGKKPRPIFIQPIDGFDVTDLSALPDGGVLVLERRYRFFEGVKMRLRRIAAAELAEGATLHGEVLLEADNRFQIDNMEGLATTINAAGDTIITLISDDNFSIFQRTLLLQFALPKPAE